MSAHPGISVQRELEDDPEEMLDWVETSFPHDKSKISSKVALMNR